jgi:hypothetical protein
MRRRGTGRFLPARLLLQARGKLGVHLIPWPSRIRVRVKIGKPSIELGALVVRERKRRGDSIWVKTIPEILRELDSLGGRQVAEIEVRVRPHGHNLARAELTGNRCSLYG